MKKCIYYKGISAHSHTCDAQVTPCENCILRVYFPFPEVKADMKKNMNTSSAALTEDDRRRMRKAALIKMLAMGVFVVVVMIFGSMHMQIKQMTA